ncbi:retinol dehydrogenase 13-like [Hydractinia symbiolongicarpus]|uniref:retinol dehydrogenase 13-like n=1 Tax=Hydractinia symbiolongicarpus TaxID=13093 RepID=UPI00254BC56E|nr:retinol dehydrogenase 13-like [Hydractinia symbiolongicarpus]
MAYGLRKNKSQIAMKLYTLLCLFFVLWGFVESRCADNDQRCRRWRKDGHCMKTEVRRTCPLSCEICNPHDNIFEDLHKSADQGIMTLVVFAMFVVIGIFVALIKVYTTGGCCRSKGTMKGKVVVITGGTNGIGLDTAFHLAARGARVIIGCRTLKKGLKVVKDLRFQSRQELIEVRKLDLSSLESVKDFAQEISEEVGKIDVLINNAAHISGKDRVVTSDGYEQTFQVNYLSHFLLTKMLIDKLKKNNPPSRIINVVCENFKKGNLDFSDLQAKKNFANIKAYNNSKLALMLFTQELSKKFKGTQLTVNAVNPGVCVTDLWNNVFPYSWKLAWIFIYPYSYLFWRPSSMAAETSYYCSLERELENVTGKYFAECEQAKCPTLDDEIARKLWEVSERLILPKTIAALQREAQEERTEEKSSDEKKDSSNAHSKHEKGD